MQISKNTILSLLVGFNTFGMTACNLPTPKDKDMTSANVSTFSNTEAATFTIELAPGKSTVLESTKDSTFGLPTAKEYTLAACFKDIYYNKSITGHTFHIEETNTDATTDSSGCLVWTERTPFNYLAESQYIKITRHISGKGIHKGTRSVNYAINPWSHGENLSAVLELKNEQSIPHLVKSEADSILALKGLASQNKTNNRNLWMDDLRLVITENKLTEKGADLQIELRGTPAIQLTKMNGDQMMRPLTEGSFQIRINLIHSYTILGKTIRRILNKTEFLNTKMENGNLSLKSALTISSIPTRGQLVLGIELNPIKGPEGLSSFAGIYSIGEYDQLKGTSSLKLAADVAQDNNFQIETYINAQANSIDKDSDAYQKPKIEISPLEFKFVRIVEDKTSSRQILLNIKACFRNGLDQKSTRSSTYKITKFKQNAAENSSNASIQTDNNACINWEENIHFKYYECQHYLKGQVQIENADLGINQKLDILINPWELSGNIGRDLRYVDSTEKISIDCKKEGRPKTQLLMDSYSYSTNSYNYQIDDLLNLNVIKKLQFKIEPKLLAYSSISNGHAEVQKLRDGVYLLRTAIINNREYDNKNTYVTSAEKIVTVFNGQINTELTFKSRDLKSLGNRNNLLLEIYPVDETKVEYRGSSILPISGNASLDSVIDQGTGLESPTFAGPIILNLDEQSKPLRILDDSAISTILIKNQGLNDSATKSLVTQVVKQGLQAQENSLQAQRNKATSPQYAIDHNLALVNLSAMDYSTTLSKSMNLHSSKASINIVKSDLQSALSDKKITKELAVKFCNFWTAEFLPGQFVEKGGGINKLSKMEFYNDCMRSAGRDPSKFFINENKLMVKQVGDTKYIKGFNQGLSVGTSFSLNKSDSTSFSTSKSLSLGARLGLGKMFLDLVSIDAGANLSASWSDSESESTSSSMSVSASTSLMVQISQLKLPITQYEKCSQIKLNPILFIKDASWFGRKDYLSILNSRLNEQEKIQVISRGLLICEGHITNQPLEVNENYYLLTQESSGSQMQDSADARNRNFFVELRSANDFNRFVLSIKGEAKMPKTAGTETLHKDVNNFMEKLFQMKDPSMPGVYSFEN